MPLPSDCGLGATHRTYFLQILPGLVCTMGVGELDVSLGIYKAFSSWYFI